MLRTTVIAKCDLARSTERMHQLTAPELGSLLTEHTQRIVKTVAQYEGSIVKGEGDAFWMIFPSVTSAALAAIDMQRVLRQSQIGVPNQDRLAMRVAIALGDVLHQEGDLFGTAMALTARIEGVTPADEIYLSHAAWLSVNHAQIQTVPVNTFQLKGFDKPEQVYRVIQQESVTIENRVMIMTDLNGFTPFVSSHSSTEIANLLTQYEALMLQAITPLGGQLRALAGDTNFCSFESAQMALVGLEAFLALWQEFTQRANYNLPMHVGIHRGDCYVFRGYLFGEVMNKASILVSVGKASGANSIVYLSGVVRDELLNTPYIERLQAVPLEEIPERRRAALEEIGVYELQMP